MTCRVLQLIMVVIITAFWPGPAGSAERQLPVSLPEQAIGTEMPKLLTLDQCIELALENNPGLQIERERIIELQNDYRIASSGLYPRITASVSYTKLDPNRAGILPQMANSEESFGLLKLRQLIYDGGKTTYNSKAAAKSREAQETSTEASRLDTIFSVSLAYYQVLEAREFVRVGENSKSQREAFFKLTDSFFKAGKATRLEQLRAEAQLLDAERSLVQAREALRLSELILKKTIGIGVQAKIDIADGLPETFSEPGDEETLLKTAMENNPDFRKVGLLKEQARMSLDSASGSYLPELSLQGTYGYRERDVGGRGDEWSAGVFLEWSLFEGGLTRGQVGKARARVRETEWSERAVIDQVQVDLSQAVGDLRTALASISSSKRLAEAQDEAYKAAVEFYKRGKSTYLEVLTAETDLTQARAAYVRAVGDYQSASARLDRVTGRRYAALPNPDMPEMH